MKITSFSIILFSILLYTATMVMTIFWIIPTLKYRFKLEVELLTIISLLATLIYSIFTIMLMSYLARKFDV